MGKVVKWDMRRLKEKFARWQRKVDKEQLEAVKAYGAEAAKLMVKCTPPGHARVSVNKALARLRERIRQDFVGDGSTEEYQDKDVKWYRDTSGRLRAYFLPGSSSAKNKKGKAMYGLVSPFRVVRGRVGKKALAALGVGRYGVEYVTDVGQYMTANRERYRVYARYKGAAARMHWYGVRHVATVASVRKEMKARQKKAGQLMAGWKAMARKSGAKLPTAVEKQSGKGSAVIRRNSGHKVEMEAINKGGYNGLQTIVDRQMPGLREKLKGMAKERAEQLGKKLK